MFSTWHFRGRDEALNETYCLYAGEIATWKQFHQDLPDVEGDLNEAIVTLK